METTLGRPYWMADGANYTIGGVIAAVLGWVGRHLWIRFRDENGETPTVRAWRRSQDGIHESLEVVKAQFTRIEALLIEADLPSMKRSITSQAAEIRAIHATQQEIREELGDRDRELHARIDRLARRLDGKDE